MSQKRKPRKGEVLVPFEVTREVRPVERVSFDIKREVWPVGREVLVPFEVTREVREVRVLSLDPTPAPKAGRKRRQRAVETTARVTKGKG